MHTKLYSQINPIQIAIADDHPAFRLGLITLLNSFHNCRVVLEAINGKELIDQLSIQKPLPDICIVDISMPELNGYETLMMLKKKMAGPESHYPLSNY